MAAITLAIILLSFTGGSGYPNGAPLDVCNDLRPGFPHGVSTQSGNGGYRIATDLELDASNGGFRYQPGRNYTGTYTGSQIVQVVVC